jgi:DNA polymerase-4
MRIILHIDMDAFYASIEQRDNPELRGLPVIVGGGSRRGVVTTASYEARRFGVKSAMPGFKARELCPHGVFLPVRMAHYVEVSSRIMEVFRRFTPMVEPLSLDEAFLDMTGCERLFGPADDMAHRIQSAIMDEVQLTASVGVAASKFVAKVASDLNKPAGITICPVGGEQAFLAPLPIEKLWGVGPRTAAKLRADGLNTVGDVAAAGLDRLVQQYGNLGEHLHFLSLGLDERPVRNDRTRLSIGSERTLNDHVRGAAAVRERLLPLVDEVVQGLRRRQVKARGVRLKIRYATFDRHTRDVVLEHPYSEAAPMLAALDGLLTRIDLDRPIRLVGVTAYDLVDGAQATPTPSSQLSLFATAEPAPGPEAMPTSAVGGRAVGPVIDQIRARFGDGALARGSSLGQGVRGSGTPGGDPTPVRRERGESDDDVTGHDPGPPRRRRG